MEQVRQVPMIDLVVIVVYLLASVGYGMWFFRKAQSAESYMVGDRSMPGWALGISIIGAYFSSISFVALPGKAYDLHWSAFVFSLSIPVVCIAAHYYFIPLYRDKLQTSAYEHLEQRFGYWARAFSGFSLIALQIARTGIVLYLLALVIHGLTGWDIQTMIVVLGILTLVYTVMGGIEGVIWADVFQTIIFVAGAFACCVLVIMKAPGGFGGIVEKGWDAGKFSLGGWKFDLKAETFWVILLYGIFENVKNFGIDQNYVQRFIAAKSDREARKSLWLGALLYIPISAMFIFIGTGLWLLYQAKPEGLPERGEDVFTYFIVNELPAGITGLVIAALLATGMDTMAVNINTSATVWIVDFYKRLIRPNSTEAQQLSTVRLASLIIGAMGTVAGLALVWGDIAKKQVLDVWWQMSSILGGGMIGLFLLGILVKKAGRQAAMVGVALGLIAIAWGTFSGFLPESMKHLAFPWHKNLIGPVGMGVVLLSGWAVSMVTKETESA